MGVQSVRLGLLADAYGNKILTRHRHTQIAAELVVKDDEVSLKLLPALLITSGGHSLEWTKAIDK